LQVKSYVVPNEISILIFSTSISSVPLCPWPTLTYNEPSYMTPSMIQYNDVEFAMYQVHWGCFCQQM
jgi:hypothetical protein